MVVAVGLLLLAAACSQKEGRKESTAVMDELITQGSKFSSTVQEAENAEAVVTALEVFVGKLDDIFTRLKAVKEKYPDLTPDETMTLQQSSIQNLFNSIAPRMEARLKELNATLSQDLLDRMNAAAKKMTDASQILK